MSLPVRHIAIGDQQWEQLHKDVWSRKFVEAYLLHDRYRERIKLRFRGGHTREYPKKSFELLIHGKTFHLNAEYDDPSMIRNSLSFNFFRRIGVASPQTRFCQLYVNGENHGIYLEIEAVDRAFFERRHLKALSLHYAVNDDANFSLFDAQMKSRKHSLLQGYETILGGETGNRHLVSFITRLNSLPQGKMEAYLAKHVDVNAYLKWLAGAVLTGNYDGFDHNYALYLTPAKKYRILPWDYEGTWGRNCYGKPCGSDLVRIRGYNHLTRKVLDVPRYRKRYRRLLMTLLKNEFTRARLMPLARKMHAQIAPYVMRDSKRKWSYPTFQSEISFIRNYIDERRDLIRQSLSTLA
ncbi:CotH kinase family protein [Paenibacillus senegalensis]|uniref:CotH kinase family protein n=1 Tax=Paenibacillus senegalensis TaxID=1465766 RepID=UPI000289B02B|nr:CotH kinase family protein [Paenibacillus senegalensis]